ncbi:rRNA biogenesis protein rrp5 [Wansuia hejianensis]|uniref:rRNA biogenesis protein rrp5 n=1 Tax=Wansuia hejianensis TaxID=2763667 RepID=A0A926INW6_9FIRM|nr:rRNA biogenesis protein rrp5 [Wansuia hejianensis]MBC8591088.1 rRNA biogenesis protein rrp5 [Wansuia hejianensis]
MSSIKLLLDVVSDMRSLADSIETVANAITSSDSENVEITATKVKEAKPKKITLEEVRGVLAKKSQAGLTSEVRDLIKKYGGEKLSEVDPSHYGSLLEDAEVLGNG